MPNVVLDASVLVSAALKPHSLPAQALHHARRHDRIVLSQQTLTELAEVLARPKFSRIFTEQVRSVFIAALSNDADFYEPTEQILDCRDAKDNKYLELAVAADAWAIVSGDADLLVLNPFRGIQILTPEAYLSSTQKT